MIKKLSYCFFIIISVIFLAACQENANAPSDSTTENDSNSNESTTTSKSDQLVVAMPADVTSLDPAVSMDNTAWKIIYNTYERLVDYDGATTNIKPGLAKEWKVSEDGKTWTFYLEDGHLFSDGTPVDAEAVKASFERTLAVDNGPAGVFSMISEIKVEDPLTVTFVLSETFPPFLSTLAANYGNIVNPKVLEHEVDGDLGQNYLASNTMGSGPYKLTEWKKGDSLKLELNEHSKLKPSITTVLFRVVSDPSVQRLQLEKGEIDIAEGIPVDQIDTLKELDNVTILQEPSLAVDYVYINNKNGNPALQDARVRQALNYAIDYDSLVSAVQLGYATQMHGPIPDGIWGHDKSVKQYNYDVEKAKQLLAEAGAEDLTISLLYSDNKTWWETEALAIQSNLADIGVTVKLNKVAYATSREMMDKGEFDLALGVWSPDFGDPYMFMNYWFDSSYHGLAGNRSFYTNSEVDKLLREAATNNDQEARQSIYKQVQDIVLEDAPYILLYQKDFILPMSKEVKGFVYNPMLESMYNLQDMSK
ncbi:peptide ABC transporter substrate-binding protein [Lysinibacillus sp. PLM2]|nr:peptide ABC transporter substrate-binding protein [Lysinibacillus sp. PLM2]